jgi:TonB-dependent receptor
MIVRPARTLVRVRQTYLVILFGTTAVVAATSGALAQETQPPPSGAVGEVVVTADAYANVKTITAKKSLDVVSDGISANQIGELPEFGLGDALRAVPGVSFVINNGRGEDQFMTIRGLNPDYDSVTIDGMVLPSTEETVRSISFDVIPAAIVSQVNVLKTWTVDQPSDAVGGVTAIHTRSAFDHPGLFVDGEVDIADWSDGQELHNSVPSGQADFVVSRTWGPNDEFGALALVSYYQRSSSTLNTYTLPYSYYPATAAGESNVVPVTLTPNTDVDGDIAIPNRHRWYWYDNVRTRPGAFLRFDFDDHHMFHGQVSGGYFTFKNDENRYSQYLNVPTCSASNTAGCPTITSATTGSFSSGSGEVDFDKYIQYRTIAYVDGSFGATLDHNTHIDLTANYGVGRYRQDTAEDQFTTASNSPALAFTYNLAAQSAPLFTPVSLTNFYNPALYTQVYHLDAVDESKSKVPQVRLDFSHNFDPTDQGFGVAAGAQWRDLHQAYAYDQLRLNPVASTAPTLATIGTLQRTLPLYDGEGQTLLLTNPTLTDAYIAANRGEYVEPSSDVQTNTVNNYVLDEMITDGYVQADYRRGPFLALAGVRYEVTREQIENFLPNTTTNPITFEQLNTTQTYDHLLPSLNLSYTPIKQVVLRGAVTETLARPEYAQLAENSSASESGGVLTESVSNPNLKPRESTNYDVSAEWYPMPGALASLALFDKQIRHEIITETTTLTNQSVPGYGVVPELMLTEPVNANKARVRGVELNLVESSFWFLPGVWKGLGGRVNAAFMDYDAPYIEMSNGTFRHLPQLIASSRDVVNAAIFYNWRQFSGEVAYNLTGKQPISFDTTNQANDQWWGAIKQIDTQFRYRLTSNVDIRFQIKNLTDARPQKIVGPEQNLNYSMLENGRAYFFGVAYHY